MELKLDTTIRNGAIDAPTAKAAARNVKQRLSALGHDISLNHAYEAVAAMSGYPTWSVMKARLHETTASPPAMTVKPFPAGRIPWAKFALDEHNPTALFFGPAGDRRSAVMAELGQEFLEAQKEDSSFLRAITFTTVAETLAEVEDAARVKYQRTEIPFWRTRISKDVCDLSVFDLPLGRRYPCPAHRERIIRFVADLVVSMEDDLSEQDVRAIAEPVPRMVDAAYSRRDRKHPRPYKSGAFDEIDRELDARTEMGGSPATWWEVSALLAVLQHVTWAQWAQAQAVPALEDFMGIIRDVDMNGVLSTGERVTDAIARCISRAIREYGFLRGVRRPGPRHSMVGVIDIIETPLDPRADAMLFRIAENEYRMLLDDIEADDAVRDLHVERMPTGAPSMRLLVSTSASPSAMAAVGLAGLLDDAVANGREVAVFTDDILSAARLREMSSSYFVHGCHDHSEVASIGKVFKLDADHVNLIHDHMVGPQLGMGAGVPLVAYRRKFHMIEKSAVILPNRE